MFTLFELITFCTFALLFGVIGGMVIMGKAAWSKISQCADDAYKLGYERGKKEGALDDGTTGATTTKI